MILTSSRPNPGEYRALIPPKLLILTNMGEKLKKITPFPIISDRISSNVIECDKKEGGEAEEVHSDLAGQWG